MPGFNQAQVSTLQKLTGMGSLFLIPLFIFLGHITLKVIELKIITNNYGLHSVLKHRMSKAVNLFTNELFSPLAHCSL